MAPDMSPQLPDKSIEDLKDSIIQAYVQSLSYISAIYQHLVSKARGLRAPFKLEDMKRHTKDLEDIQQKLKEAAENCERASSRARSQELLDVARESYQATQDTQ